VLLETIRRPVQKLEVAPDQTNIARVVPLVLEQYDFLQQELDDTLSSKAFDRYIELLDGMHLHFLQSDIAEFEPLYRTHLDELLKKKGDVAPANHIFSRFLQRLTQRVDYVGELLATEKFEFTGTDRYNLDRKKTPRPKDLEEAKQLWRQHLRYEILQDKLNKEKPEDIASKITKRYSRLLRSLQEYDRDDVFELYLSAVAQVFDPHTDYMGKSSLDTFNINMSLSLTGIGALLRSEDGYCKIQSLVANGPAQKSKQLKENDRIIAVAQGANEAVDVVEMKLNKVVDMIRGRKGTEVRLTVIPADAPDPSVRKVVSLIRDEIKLEDQEAKAKIIDFPATTGKPIRVGVIDLPSFYAAMDLTGKKEDDGPRKSTTRDVALLLRKLTSENVDGIILDLRRNGGGSLEEAINLTGLFIKEGPVVQVKDHDGEKHVDSDKDESVLYDGPLVVLTSRFSASASEILAGALQDYGRALIVGDKSTHGKGTVQQLIDLKRIGALRRSAISPGAVKVTIRKFYRPSGSSTQLKGVTPDLILPSPNNHADVGESALENALPWDTITEAKFEKLNRVQPYLAEIQKRSLARLETDPDFQYLKEDIDQVKKALADRTVSLNEAQRVKEKAEAEARAKARQAELKARPSVNETAYEITLALADKPGLPPATGQAKPAAKTESASDSKKADEDEDAATESKAPLVDVTLKEAKRILADFISLGRNDPSIAATSPKPSPDAKTPGNLGATGAVAK
ncbi:MAG: carboxy terminal-processing peptidase, partial [Verrucomicrobia bacterium]|nr:carboxy terminal-processing peptidase [Verrucomicrobiota bacterium]